MAKATPKQLVEATMNITVEMKFTTYNQLDYEQAVQAINDSIRSLKEGGQNFKFSLEAKEDKW